MDARDFQCIRGPIFVGSQWNKFRPQRYEGGPLFPGLRTGTASLTLILKKVENKEAGTSAAQTHVFETSLKVFSTTAQF
jgi:hypothetical protein